ncbi:uncharacterized protein LOC128672716 [Plodia interpunctella]|uniref:uncharacterized protein LOC128672716 n=1 Tax=Plodia interpunctella TaxID=58824 RepID=UPI002367C14A|nr:uncharacterized protein LOC128672716 [Plodia interpunctella]XP_053606006.1 uncharacterized protein LOC128672716 [Plodia interpunctella]
MESEANTDKNHGAQKSITPVGHAWVLSRSKSYSGRVYYFNTLTGEAVWNLSNEEIEKAKKRTAKLPLQLDNFPEPREPPCDHGNHDSYQDNIQQSQISQYTSPSVYNNQIINSNYPRPHFQPYVTPCQNCTPMSSIQNMVGIRPDMWIHHPPIFLGNPSPSLTNINQTTENISHDNCCNHNITVQNTSVSLSRRFAFENTKPRGKHFSVRSHGVGKFTPWNYKFNVRKTFTPRRMPNGVSDLRNIISGKKIVNETLKVVQENNHNTVQEHFDCNKISLAPGSSSSKLESKIVEDILIVHKDEEWLKNNGTIDGTKIKLDINILKNLATENSDCVFWYIVVDKNVLMHHFNFLNVLTTSDQQCKLLVPRGVLSQLQAAARAGAALSGARAVLRGLSQLFAAQRAVIAEYSFKPSEIKDGTGMINFCLMLRRQNEHMILLSNEEALQKNTSNIPIFTIKDVKELLTSDKYEQVKMVNPIIERNIKVTIPNDIQSCAHTSDDVRAIETLDTNIPVRESSHKTCNTETNTKETNVQTEDLIPIARKMVDAEVQTDLSLEFTQTTVQKDSVGVNTVENFTQMTYVDKETNVVPENSTIIGQKNNAVKRQESNTTISHDNTREARLKRSISNLTSRSNSNDGDKKHFKWHRKRRDESMVFSDSTSSFDDGSSRQSAPFEIHAYAPQISNIFDDMYQPPSQSTQIYYSDYGEGSENSSVCMQKEASENILIEETSTSEADVISNSISNVGSETQEINKGEENSKATSYKVKSKNVMFEITSKEMEQNLRTRRDEWLAEFNQIMEEVLTQILRRKSEDIVKAMPPPWTLHEAAECIKRTFIGDYDVFEAASRLSQVLHRMSDIKGKIKIDFNPNEFMELYSYGVYLVDSLQSILDKCEDLQVASESLAKLLKHIESPMAEGGANDSFGDTTDVPGGKSCVEAGATEENTKTVSNKSSSSRRTPKEAKNIQSPGKYNLRSSKKMKPNEENDENRAVKFVRKINIRDDFFTSLHLLRKDETETVNDVNIDEEDPIKLTHNIVHTNSETPAAKEPNVIRNFNICPEFEEKLKNKYKEPLDMDKLDYSNYNDELIDYEYDNMEESYLDEYDHYNIQGNEEEYMENNKDEPVEEAAVDANNNNFKMLVIKLMGEIKQTTANVYSFCKTTQDEIQSKNFPSGRRMEIHDKAQKTNAHIKNICNLFRRIHEVNNENGLGKSRLKEAGILLNDREEAVYRNVIGSCIEQGNTLLESINVIIEAIKT